MSSRGFVVWLTGIPAAGKSTNARLLAPIIKGAGYRVQVLDGDEVRRTICDDLGFSKEDREEQARRVATMARDLADKGMAIIVALITPYQKSREEARDIIGSDRLVEVYIRCSVEECMIRDPKGQYKRARMGEIKGFTGYDDPYEQPSSLSVLVDTEQHPPEETVRIIVRELVERQLIFPECTVR